MDDEGKNHMSKRQARMEESKKTKQEMNLITDQSVRVESEDFPLDTRESFWKYVLKYDTTSHETLFAQLEKSGVELPAPELLEDVQLAPKLWDVVHRLASMGVFLSETDHLSDRELYKELWDHILREERRAIAMGRRTPYHIDILGGCSQRDMHLYLKYYADEEFRRQWKIDFPQDAIPEAENRPYERDRILPQPYYGPPEGNRCSEVN